MDSAHILPLLIGLGLLLCMSAFFSGSETALCALTRVQIEHLRSDTRKSSLSIIGFVDNPRRLFITILLGNVLVNISFATLTSALIYELFSRISSAPGSSGLAVAVATPLITILLLIFGEITPKTYALRHAEPFARITARPLWAFSIAITPVRVVLRSVTNVLIPVFGGGEISSDENITADDIRAALDARVENGQRSDESELLDNILELRDIEASEIMVPRIEMIAMSTSSTIQEVLHRAKAAGFSRIPIYRGQIDNLSGIFHVKDLPLWSQPDLRSWTIDMFLEHRSSLSDSSLVNTLVRAPYFVVESKKLTDLFAELVQRKTKIAILIDEHGGVSGSITMEDIIEEIIGDVFDEHDRPPGPALIVPDPEDPARFRVFGRASLRMLNQELRLGLDEAVADTVAGYVFALFGSIPSVGESKSDVAGIVFEVAATRGNAITDVIMTLPRQSDTGSGK